MAAEDKEFFPYISIIIPCRPGTRPSVLRSLEGLDYPKDKYKIIVEHGYNPSAQRNQGIRSAKGDILAFTDDDCSVEPDWLNRAIRYFNDADVGIVGGPNLTPADDSLLSHCFGYALGSYFGTATMHSRYEKVSIKDEITEKNLIFANMFVKRDVFDRGIFLDEAMFPNEENEFIHRVQQSNFRLVYVPEVYVYHPRKKDVLGFSKQLFNYGCGRAHQSKIQPGSFEITFILPTLFFLGIVLIPISFVLNIKSLYVVLLLSLTLYLIIAITIIIMT